MLRIIETRKRKIRLNDRIYSREQLKACKKVVLEILNKMNISPDKVRRTKIRFATDMERGWNFAAWNYYCDEILLTSGEKADIIFERISHEMGHKVTRYGDFGLIGRSKKNILGECSADNFERRFLKIFNHVKKTNTIYILDFIGTMKHSPIHAIAYKLSFIPLGSLIKEEYKNK